METQALNDDGSTTGGTPGQSLPISYADAAVTQLRAVIKGNGADPDKILIERFKGEIEKFQGALHLKPNPTTTEKFQPGRKSIGEKVSSLAAAHAKIEETNKRIFDSEQIAAITALIKARPDQGIGLRNGIIKLPFLTREYHVHDTCKPCSGRGDTKCTRCHGKGNESCPRCYAQGQEICTACQGAREIYNGQQKVTCMQCNGMGRVPCRTCRQTRVVTCAPCQGKGNVMCSVCKGDGASTLVITSDMAVIGNWQTSEGGAPPAVMSILEKDPALLAAQADIIIQARPSGTDCALDYTGTLPRADMNVVIKNGFNLPVRVIGRDGVLYRSAPFLEKLMAPGLNDLARAALPGGDTAGLLLRAARYRTLRQAILASARAPRAKAIRWLAHHTPIGLQDKTVAVIIDQIHKALAHITAKPRRDGFLIGLLLALILHGLYIQGRGYMWAQELVRDLYGLIALDVLLLAAGAAMICASVLTYSRRALRAKLGKILPKDFKISASDARPYRVAGLWALALMVSFLFFAALNEINLRQTGHASFGYSLVRSQITQ